MYLFGKATLHRAVTNPKMIVMRLFNILAISVLSITSLQSQNSPNCDCYDRLLNLSEYFEQAGKLDKALEVFKAGLSYKEKGKWTSYEYYKVGELHALNDEFEEACVFLGKAYAMGFDMSYSRLTDHDQLIKSKYWEEMMEVRDSLKREYQKNINMDYRLGIEDIRGSDQTIRRLIRVPDSTFQQLDSINYYRLVALINEYGYPNVEKHGFDGSQGAYLILLHASMYSEEKYQDILQILNDAIQEYSYRRSRLAQFIDRRENWHHERSQIYGTWNAYGSNEFKAIADIEGVDHRRFQFNLLRIEEQAIIEDRNLPSKYKSDEYPDDYFCGYRF
jgi:tetratricopeptide (TPR) repeat protein